MPTADYLTQLPPVPHRDDPLQHIESALHCLALSMEHRRHGHNRSAVIEVRTAAAHIRAYRGADPFPDAEVTDPHSVPTVDLYAGAIVELGAAYAWPEGRLELAEAYLRALADRLDADR